MKQTLTVLLAVSFILVGIAGAEPQSLQPTVTPVFMFIYGYGTLDRGDEVAVRVGDGVLCGLASVTEPGQYGLMAVYGNDPFSSEKDGADTGEILQISVNGSPVVFPVGSEPRFGRDGDTLQVDLD